MRRPLQILGAAVAGLVLLGGTAIAAAVSLNAECLGPSSECPRSAAYRYTLLALPIAALALVVAGTGWSVRRRSLQPVVLAEAVVLGLDTIVDSVLDYFGAVNALLLATAIGIGWSAFSGIRRARPDPAPPRPT